MRKEEAKKTLEERYKRQNQYIKNKYDRISAVFPKGTKERIEAITAGTDIKTSAFIANAVIKELERVEAAAAGPGSIEAAPDPDENDPDYLPFH